MKVAIKNKSEWRYIEAEDIMIGDVTLGDLYKQMQTTEDTFLHLIKQLHGKFIVDADKPYILQVGDNLQRVEKLIVHEDTGFDKPLTYYKVENGKIVVDRKKVGAV